MVFCSSYYSRGYWPSSSQQWTSRSESEFSESLKNIVRELSVVFLPLHTRVQAMYLRPVRVSARVHMCASVTSRWKPPSCCACLLLALRMLYLLEARPAAERSPTTCCLLRHTQLQQWRIAAVAFMLQCAKSSGSAHVHARGSCYLPLQQHSVCRNWSVCVSFGGQMHKLGQVQKPQS